MKKIAHNIHDNTFKALMYQREFVLAIIQTHLPSSLIKGVDWQTFKVERLDTEHISPDLAKTMRGDVLCSAHIEGSLGFFYLHVEHQSTADETIALRILNYQSGFLLNYKKKNPKKKLPLLISLVYYHGQQSPFPHSLNWLDAFEQPDLAAQYTAKPILIDVSIRDDTEIKTAPKALAGPEIAFKYIRQKQFGPYLNTVLEILQTTPLQIRQITLNYIVRAANVDKTQLITTIHNYLPNDEGFVMNVAQQCKQEGIEQGIRQGVQQGIQQGVQQGIQQGVQQGIQQGVQQGIRQGVQQGIEKIAKEMLAMGDALDKVSRVTGLSKEKLELLQSKITV